MSVGNLGGDVKEEEERGRGGKEGERMKRGAPTFLFKFTPLMLYCILLMNINVVFCDTVVVLCLHSFHTVVFSLLCTVLFCCAFGCQYQRN